MTILCYHTVEPDCPSRVAVEPEAFRTHMEWVAAHRTVLDLDAAAARVDERGRLPRGTTAVTFDDGFRGVLRHALPVLRRHRLTATVFVVAATIADEGKRVDWVDDAPRTPLDTLTVDDLRELQDTGVSIGSHSWAHHDLPAMSEDECVEDLRASRQLLEDVLRSPVRHLAYPRGRHTAHVRRAAERAGFAAAFTLPEVREPVGLYAIPRVGIYPGNGVGALRIKLAHRYLDARLDARVRSIAGWARRTRSA